MQNGKHFKLTITTGSKVIQNEFTLGEECELETMTGEKVKVGGAPSHHSLLLELSLNLVLGIHPARLPPHSSHHGYLICGSTSAVGARETTASGTKLQGCPSCCDVILEPKVNQPC